MIEIDGKVEALSLSEHDTLVYTTPVRLNRDQLVRITDYLRERFPKNNVLVVDAGATLTVITEETQT